MVQYAFDSGGSSDDDGSARDRLRRRRLRRRMASPGPDISGDERTTMSTSGSRTDPRTSTLDGRDGSSSPGGSSGDRHGHKPDPRTATKKSGSSKSGSESREDGSKKGGSGSAGDGSSDKKSVPERIKEKIKGGSGGSTAADTTSSESSGGETPVSGVSDGPSSVPDGLKQRLSRGPLSGRTTGSGDGAGSPSSGFDPTTGPGAPMRPEPGTDSVTGSQGPQFEDKQGSEVYGSNWIGDKAREIEGRAVEQSDRVDARWQVRVERTDRGGWDVQLTEAGAKAVAADQIESKIKDRLAAEQSKRGGVPDPRRFQEARESIDLESNEVYDPVDFTDVSLTGDGATLKGSTKREFRRNQRERARQRAKERFESQTGMDVGDGDVRVVRRDGRFVAEPTQRFEKRLDERQKDRLESRLETQIAARRASRGGNVDQAQYRHRLQRAREDIDLQQGEDFTFSRTDDGMLTASATPYFQEQMAARSLDEKLDAKTGVDLERGKHYTVERQDDGSYEAELTRAGERKVRDADRQRPASEKEGDFLDRTFGGLDEWAQSVVGGSSDQTVRPEERGPAWYEVGSPRDQPVTRTTSTGESRRDLPQPSDEAQAAAAAALPLALAEPTPAGEIGIGGFLAISALTGGGLVAREAYERGRNNNAPAREPELAVPGGATVPARQPETLPQEEVTGGELEIPEGATAPARAPEAPTPEGDLYGPDITVEPGQMRGRADPTSVQLGGQVAIGEQRRREEAEEPEVDIADEERTWDLPERERIRQQRDMLERRQERFDPDTGHPREFPTGEEAVVGRGRDMAEEAQEQRARVEEPGLPRQFRGMTELGLPRTGTRPLALGAQAQQAQQAQVQAQLPLAAQALAVQQPQAQTQRPAQMPAQAEVQAPGLAQGAAERTAPAQEYAAERYAEEFSYGVGFDYGASSRKRVRADRDERGPTRQRGGSRGRGSREASDQGPLAVGYVAETYAGFSGLGVAGGEPLSGPREGRESAPFGELLPDFSGAEDEQFESALDMFGLAEPPLDDGGWL